MISTGQAMLKSENKYRITAAVDRPRLQLQFRFLNIHDIDEIKLLCRYCFPLNYPHYWFTLITSDQRFFSLAALVDNKIVGMLVAEIKCKCQVQEQGSASILASSFGPDTHIAYIMSLGVHPFYRRKGIASELIKKFLNEVSVGNSIMKVKAVYLHVLTSNLSAIQFYKGLNFRRLHYLRSYYLIQGKPHDGFSYVLYINGGRPPWSYGELFVNFFSAIQDLQPCKVPLHFFYRLFFWFLPERKISPVVNRFKLCHNL